ncbi:ATP-binding cassette domain-containing protein [Bradyrhizobium sp. CCGUVB23]|uniref:ATP-binding cassette domain-containing protein n=1 Tax=Bradyrhizobium sp. CCGUVB23 TaxID=2949630 RepID=UPI003531E78B
MTRASCIIPPDRDADQVLMRAPSASMSQESVLETQSLEKWFGGVQAVAGVDFKMRRGELRCLIGPNGAGKSTFFKLVTGQLRASGGHIIFDGQEITGRAPHTIGRLGIGIKNQVPSVFEGLSVAENLWLAARLRHSTTGARVAVHEMIYRLNLGNVAKQTVGTLAHGMRQWVDIGMVMAQRPKLMLLDEPTAGMAAEEIDRTVELIRVINSDASVVVVEHDMEFIRRLNSFVTVFHQGRILVEGAMDNVQRDPRVREVYLGRSRHT